jgi:hypothetical protein
MAGADHNKVVAAAMAILLMLALGGGTVWVGTSSHRRSTLDNARARDLLTYRRNCRTQADCEAPLLCMSDAQHGGWRCLASECETDSQCEPGFMCTPFHFPRSPPIQLCLIQGIRNEGEPCTDFPLHAEHGCRPGLICNSGFCGRPCRPDGSPTCPEGFTCHPGNNDPACLPSCLRTGCPQDKRCVRLVDELAVCAVVHGHDCETQPCPTGEVCRRETGRQAGGQDVIMWCARPCDGRGDGGCPRGSVCVAGFCERTCDEAAPTTCGPGERCTRTFLPGRTFAVCAIDG